MLVFDDLGGLAGRFAADVFERLELLGVYEREAARGSRTSRCSGFAVRRGCNRRCPVSARSVRPGPLSTIPCFVPTGRSTSSSNRLH